MPLDTHALRRAIVRSRLSSDLEELASLRSSRNGWGTFGFICILGAWIPWAIARGGGGPSGNQLSILFYAMLGIGLLSLLMSLVSGYRFRHYEPTHKVKSVRIGLLAIQPAAGYLGEYLCDSSGVVEPIRIEYPPVEIGERLVELRQKHTDLLSSMGMILPAVNPELVRWTNGTVEDEQLLFSEEADLHRNLEEALSVLDTQRSSIDELPLLHVTQQQRQELAALSDQTASSWREAPVLKAPEAPLTEDVVNAIARLEGEIEEMESEASRHTQMQDFLRSFLDLVQHDVGRLAGSHQNALEKALRRFAHDIERLSVRFSLNCYCPSCNREVLEAMSSEQWEADGRGYPKPDVATRMAHVPGTESWECPVCGQQTENPFVVHGVLDELIHPVMDKLLQENAVERLKLYRDAKERKTDILQDAEREIRETIRASEHEVRELQSRIRGVTSELSQIKYTTKLLVNQLEHLRELEGSDLLQIARDVARQSSDIARQTRDALNEYHEDCNRMQRLVQQEMRQIAHQARVEDRARMEQLASVARSVQEQGARMASIAKQGVRQSHKDAMTNNRLTQALVRDTRRLRADVRRATGQ